MRRSGIIAAVAVLASIGLIVLLVQGHGSSESGRTDGEKTTVTPQESADLELADVKAPETAVAGETAATPNAPANEKPSGRVGDSDVQQSISEPGAHEFDRRMEGYRQRIQELREQLGPLRDDPKRRSELARSPFPALDELDEAELVQMLRKDDTTYSEAAVRGQEIGRNISPDEWILWFEKAGQSGGLRGQVTVAILNSAFLSATMDPRKRQSLNFDRMLSLLDGHLRAWQDEPVGTLAITQLTLTLQRMSPVAGGLELIRRWLVETPHGNEIVEKGLFAALAFWPFNDAAPPAREALLTLRGGPIKGAIECWGQVKRRTMNPAWTEEDMRSLLPTLVDCVKRTPSAAAVLLASALAGKDLLHDYCIEIGWALLERTDSRACAAMGFHFFSHVDLSLACATWLDWFNSHDENQVAVACIAAPKLRDHVIGDTERDRLKALAMDEARSAFARASAAEALCQVETGFVRSREVMASWVVRPVLDDAMLVALGRMTVLGKRTVVEATLQRVIDDASRTPQERHYSLFLLATRNPLAALAVCEQQATATQPLFDPATLLLAAATVEAMLPDQTYKRTAAVRAAIAEPEPDWVTELRLRRDVSRAEHRVVRYAWSSAPARDS